MNINATIIVQAVNFLIAYIILRTLFFRPTVMEIQSDQQERNVLIDGIKKIKEQIAKKERDRINNQQLWNNFCKQNQPPMVDPSQFIFRNITPDMLYPSLPENQVLQEIDEVSKLIIRKMKGQK